MDGGLAIGIGIVAFSALLVWLIKRFPVPPKKRDPWICDVCGNVVAGDMCPTCGNQMAQPEESAEKHKPYPPYWP